MAKKLSFNEIASRLGDKINSEQDRTKRIMFFQPKLVSGYEKYRKKVTNEHQLFSEEQFADELLRRHNNRYSYERQSFHDDYFNHETYIDSLVSDTITKLLIVGHKDYTFQVKERFVNDLDIICDQYVKLVNNASLMTTAKTLVRQIAKKALDKMAVGVDLIARNFIDESLIIWRSFLEDVTIVKIIYDFPDQPLEARFMTNKQDTLVDLGIIQASSAHKNSLRDQTKKHIGHKSARHWEILRYSWVGCLLREKDYSSAKMRELVGLDDFNPHYNFTSIFVHQRTIDDQDLSLFSLGDYALMLYWKLFDQVLKKIIVALFDLEKKLPLDTSEKDIRRYLKRKFDEKFKEFTASLS